MVSYKALNTRRKYRKTEQLSVFQYFRLSQRRSLKDTKKEGNLHRKLPSSLSSLLSDSNQRPRDYKSRALANWAKEAGGQLLTSRRYNQLPLLRSRPGGFEGSWPCKTAHVIDLRKQAFQGVKTKRSQCYCWAVFDFASAKVMLLFEKKE